MPAKNPYEPPQEAEKVSAGRVLYRKMIVGPFLLAAGLLSLAYGAYGFWGNKTLPSNGGANSRLPSLYIMSGAVALCLAGLIVKSLCDNMTGNNQQKNISSTLGILILLGLLAVFFAVVSQL